MTVYGALGGAGSAGRDEQEKTEMTFSTGDIVLPRLHQSDRREARMLEVEAVTVTGRIRTKARNGRRMTFEPHQIVLVRRK